MSGVWIFLIIIFALFLYSFTPWVQKQEEVERQQKANEKRAIEEEQKQDLERLMASIHEHDLRRINQSHSIQKVRAELAADRSIAWRIFARDGYRCVKCGANGTDSRNDLTVEHKIPVSAGGTNIPIKFGNLVSKLQLTQGRKFVVYPHICRRKV